MRSPPTPALASADLLEQGAIVRVRWDDGHAARFHAFWLIDNSLEPDTRHAGNGQRLITIDQVPLDAVIRDAAVSGDKLILTTDAREAPLLFTADWLRRRIYDAEPHTAPAAVMPGLETWGQAFGAHLGVHAHDDVTRERRAKAAWLADIRRFGVSRLSGAPVHPGAVAEIARLFGYVRETNYGEVFQVRAEVSPSNLAYTNAGLQAHTDNPYRDPVPTLQLLACLENSVDGGESVVVDGFHAAQVLHRESPADFDILTRYPARFEYAGQADVHLSACQPMIELSPDGLLKAVRFNSRSVAPLVDIPFARMPDYYRAYRHFSDIIDRADMHVRFRLAPGDVFIVDNRRVLHARTAFSGTGKRLLEGCYADIDGLLSTLTALEREIGDAAA